MHHSGVKEADIALKVGKLVSNYLIQASYQVILFQYDGLEEICSIANKSNSDLFVSIHLNASNGKASGCETYSYYGSNNGLKLSKKIHNQITTSFPELIDRGTKTANYYVLSYTDMPSCLIEMGFIDNDNDLYIIQNNIDKMAACIARGISDYYIK